jgi:membrane associated rhomboid family serine protease
MRLLRELDDEATAQRLLDALSDQGIETELKRGSTSFGVWVIDEQHMPRAGELARNWLEHGQHEAFEQTASRGARARELTARIEERRQRHIEALARQLQAFTRPRPTPLTWGLIALCAALHLSLFLLAKYAHNDEQAMLDMLTIVDPRRPVSVSFVSLFGFTFTWLPLPLHEPWRLVTPILVHYFLLHIIFNMVFLRDLGRVIETFHGTRYLAAFIVVCGAVSNIAQYQIAKNPHFAGMSGVVYGLLGLVWVRHRLDPSVGYELSKPIAQFMMIWLAMGFLGNFHVANWCHLFGLLVGAGWAYASHKLARLRR